VTLYPDGKYTQAPALISDPKHSNITTKDATIDWVTDRLSDSKIQYGLGTDSFFSSEPSNSVFTTDHTISLSNLQPGTKYYYKAKWTDEDGNTGSSDVFNFTTSPPPSVQDVVVKTVGLNNVALEFTTTGASSVKVLYGETTSFGGIHELSTSSSASSYTVSLEELADGTKYYFKVNAYDAEGNEYEGTILSFETLPRPQISNIRVQQVKGAAQPSAVVSWTTNTPVSSIISYFPENQPDQNKDVVEITLQNGEHKLLVNGLKPQTTYVMIVKGRDKAGNEAQSEIQRLTTSVDTRPPQVTNLKVETSTTTPNGSDQAISQLVVSWDTDEPSTSQVDFAEGTGSTYQQRTQEDQNFTNNHVVVVGNLTPSKVYHLRAVSRDVASNEGSSVDTVVITAKATDSALDLVVNNLQQAFGFLKNIR
jgi:phosphodiesterase/alkaline phosphatase D-like protein